MNLTVTVSLNRYTTRVVGNIAAVVAGCILHESTIDHQDDLLGRVKSLCFGALANVVLGNAVDAGVYVDADMRIVVFVRVVGVDPTVDPSTNMRSRANLNANDRGSASLKSQIGCMA